MLYVLHHSKGTLILSAGSREQVHTWSRRQLGHEAERASIIEGDCLLSETSVEKDGTGIEFGGEAGCQPLMGFMANLAQDVSMEQGSSGRHETWRAPPSRPGVPRATLH
jgi:hypothetical protein